MPVQTTLRVLLTNLRLDGRSGTEVVVRDLALGLQSHGHRPTVYSPHLGDIARELRDSGIEVVSSIQSVTDEPDVIHGHHVLQTGVAVARFPMVPAIFVCHDSVAWHDSIPHLPSVRRLVGVGDATTERLRLESPRDQARITTIPNGVDIRRFRSGPPPPAQPRKALAMIKGPGGLAAIREACLSHGIQLDVAGSFSGQLLERPEECFGQYDLIFASGLTALEAMACLRPVIVCDHRGLAGFVSPETFDEWRARNFGRNALIRPMNAELLSGEIRAYNWKAAVAVGERVRAECHLDKWVDQYLALYQACIAEWHHHPTPSGADEMAAHLERWTCLSPEAADRDAQLSSQRILERMTGLRPLKPGSPTAFSESHHFHFTGFHDGENWGRWSAASPAVVGFLVAPSDLSPTLQITYTPYLSNSVRLRRTRVSLNGTDCGEWVDEGSALGTTCVKEIPVEPDIASAGALFLAFETDHQSSPQEDGVCEDVRRLGIGLLSISILGTSAPAPMAEALESPPATELCTVVISRGNPPTLVDAVKSLLPQQPAEQILVVNSGGGNAKAMLENAGIHVRVVEYEHPLYPGGARNAGISLTCSKYIAFLASDCIAQPGWVEQRLKAHRSGDAAVASALLCHRPGHPIALAAHLTLFCKRLPRMAAREALRYGASYERKLFERYGLFREDIQGGEDTEFHERLPRECRPVWRPQVRTLHRGPSTLAGFLKDQHARGQRAFIAWRTINGRGRLDFALGVVGRIASTISISLKAAEPGTKAMTIATIPLIAAGGLTYALGVMSTRRSS